ncbi:MAG: hypothetical protein PHR10_10125 [Sphaerochaetaceae bacterium]|jgi:hypothetical protein|nr:hypothetical protein [Sphaerochaetaceae bacterium]
MQAKEGKKYALPEDYLNILEGLDEIEKIIMGKDPYPEDPTGIPFCKNAWNAVFQNNCSGRYVLSALGYKRKEILEGKYGCPADFFKYLAGKKGIVFLNMSYHYIGGSLRKKEHEGYIEEARATNMPIMEKAKSIFICGAAGKLPWIASTWIALKGVKVINVVHPDVRNRSSKYQSVRDEWKKNWGTKSSLNRG